MWSYYTFKLRWRYLVISVLFVCDILQILFHSLRFFDISIGCTHLLVIFTFVDSEKGSSILNIYFSITGLFYLVSIIYIKIMHS